MLFDDHLAGRKRLFQYIDGSSRIGLAAHEHVECGITVLGPAMNRDVRLSKHGYTRHAAIWREVMQVDVQERSSSDIDAASKRRFDVLYVVEPFRPNQIDDEMSARITDPITFTEKVLALVSFRSVAPIIRFFRLGGA